MMIWLEMGGKDAPRSFLPQYEALNTKTVKTPRPFRHAMIWPIFSLNFEHKGKFRQHLGQKVLAKLFSPKSTYQSGQKTYLQFSYISLTFLAILDRTFYRRKPLFRNNLVHLKKITKNWLFWGLKCRTFDLIF